jgi:DNA polymerase III epsilon subunit-like protein
MNLFHVDTETTGFDSKKHEIIELAFAIEIDGIVHCEMDLFMRPEKWDTIDQKALDSNGWTIERLKLLPDRVQFYKLFRHVPLFSPPLSIVEYGNKFDYRFLESFHKEAVGERDFNLNFRKQSINVLSLAKKKLPGLKSYKLKDVARRLGIPVDDKKLHGAAYDRDLMMGIYNILKWR